MSKAANTCVYLSMLVLAMAVCDPLRAADDQVHVVPASELEQWWQASPGHRNEPPPYPLDAVKEGVAGCIAVAFEIHGDGSISNERVWHSDLTGKYAQKELEDASLIAVHSWRFVPATANVGHDPVYTYQTLTFMPELSAYPMDVEIFINKPTKADNTRAAQQADKLQAKCEMPDFAQQVQAMISAGVQAHPLGSSP